MYINIDKSSHRNLQEFHLSSNSQHPKLHLGMDYKDRNVRYLCLPYNQLVSAFDSQGTKRHFAQQFTYRNKLEMMGRKVDR